MDAAEIRDAIKRNLEATGLDADDVRVQPDLYEGWRVAVISTSFIGKTTEERRGLALAGLEDVDFEWVDLLTPEEREWSGELPLDSDLDDLPLWHLVLARGNVTPHEQVLFASDLDEDLPLPIVATFYSFRGGVGRSTSLAYTAQLLGARGAKVVCVDMDLEAPGLAALFNRESEVSPGIGLVHILAALDRGEQPDLSQHLLRVSEANDVYCLPAGRPDAEYARLLQFIDPAAWYREERNPLRLVIDGLSDRLPFQPDVILLDARTGITTLSAPLLFDLSDVAIIVFFPHPQSKTGTDALLKGLLAAKTRRRIDNERLTPEPRFIVSPIPASKAPEVVRRYEHRALEWIAGWLGRVDECRQSQSPLLESELTQFIHYREGIATSDSIHASPDAWRDYAPVAEWIERFLPAESEARVPTSLGSRKSRILDEMQFSSGTAEDQESFLETFVETALVTKALSPAIPLVLGRKGTGKTAIFRRLLEDSSKLCVPILAPAVLRSDRPWMLDADGFDAIDKFIRETASDWRRLWAAYIALACLQSRRFASHAPFEDAGIIELLDTPISGQLSVVSVLCNVLRAPNSALLISDLLRAIDQRAPEESLLIFDGLDTGFGSDAAARTRRKQAIEGLFSFLVDRADQFGNLRAKVVLRDDIWRSVQFENKSHLYGRSVRLAWPDKADFFKVAIRQALRAEGFSEIVSSTLSRSGDVEMVVGSWPESDVFSAWNVLIGERMKGGKTAFTRNWVWNRLADGTADHSPRYLLQLFDQVTDWERREETRSPYERSVIRPRGLIQVLPKVSEYALSALRDEEFPELRPLLQKLTELGRTPVNADELSDVKEHIVLAMEVGLLTIYEGTDERVDRYKVPDLYRHALNMSRRGQA